MTGTAVTEAGEFWEIYKLDVVEIPTNRPIARADKEDLVYKTKREKYNAVIEDIVKLVAAKRPVLVGTTSVEISELLSTILRRRGIKHNVLNISVVLPYFSSPYLAVILQIISFVSAFHNSWRIQLGA